MDRKSKVWQIVLLVLLLLAIIAILLFNHKLNANKETLASTLAQLTTVQENSAALQADLDAAKADYDDVSAQLTDAQAEAQRLTDEVESGKTASQQLQDALDAANGQVAELQTAAEASAARISELEVTAARVTKLELNAQAASNRVAELEVANQTATDRIAALETELAEKNADLETMVDAYNYAGKGETPEASQVGVSAIGLRRLIDSVAQSTETADESAAADLNDAHARVASIVDDAALSDGEKLEALNALRNELYVAYPDAPEARLAAEEQLNASTARLNKLIAVLSAAQQSAAGSGDLAANVDNTSKLQEILGDEALSAAAKQEALDALYAELSEQYEALTNALPGDATAPADNAGDATAPADNAGDATAPADNTGDATEPADNTGDATTPADNAGDQGAEGADSSLADAETAIASLNGQIDALTSSLSDNETQVTSLTAEIDSLTAQSAADAARIAELNGQIEALNGQATADAEVIADLNHQVETLTAQNTADNEKLESLNAQLQSLQDEAAAGAAQLADLNDQLATQRDSYEKALAAADAYRLDRTPEQGDAHASVALQNEIAVAADGVTADLHYTNNDISNNAVVFSLELDGEALFTSEQLKPGESIEGATLSRALPAGAHEAMAVTSVYGADGIRLSGSRLPIVLNVAE